MTTGYLYHRFRWVHGPMGVLLLLLQRMPVIRLVAQAETIFGSSSAAIVRSGFLLAVMGAFDSVAGATQLSSSPASPATTTAGNSFNMIATVINAPGNPASMQYTGALPPGLTAWGSTVTGAFRNAVDQNGLVNNRYITFGGTPTTAGSYTFTVTGWEFTNGGGRSASFSVTINVNANNVAPAITTQPVSMTVVAGQSASFTVAASGTPTPTYQWYKDTQSLGGQTSTTLSFSPAQMSDAGTYHAVAANSVGSVSSNDVVLTVQTVPIVTSMGSTVFTTGLAGEFTVTASGDPAPTFIASGLPAWASFSTATGVLSGTPPDTSGAPYILTLSATNVAGTSSTQSFSLAVKTRFQLWQEVNFTLDDLANAAVSGANVALAGDGLPNLVKFALGYSPRAVVPSTVFGVQASGGQMSFTFQCPATNPGAIYEVETSTNLVTWTTNGVTLQQTATDGTTATWSGTVTTAGASQFLRLKITEL